MRTPGARSPSAVSASIHMRQSSPPITATVSAISFSVAGARVTSTTFSESSSMVRLENGAPMGLSAELWTAPVRG